MYVKTQNLNTFTLLTLRCMLRGCLFQKNVYTRILYLQEIFDTKISQISADQFYTSYNGRLYNSMEKETCQLVFVKKVELRKSSQGGSLPSVGMTELPSCPVCLEKLVRSRRSIRLVPIPHSWPAFRCCMHRAGKWLEDKVRYVGWCRQA